MMKARYVHTNLIARDWRALAEFYTRLFGCIIVPPERDYRSPDLDRLTALPNAHQFGAHLRLPGWGENGPTLEIFGFDALVEGQSKAINRPGFGHIAFEVEDVQAAYDLVLAHGGSAIGQVVTLTNAVGARVTVCYVADPEGNAIELQRWYPPIASE
jgi:catechol 2,3-dioxygenase-like lactoylglutathione lyase family enzyme